MNQRPHREYKKPLGENRTTISWSSVVYNIDEETGEILTKTQITQQGYVKIHTEISYEVNTNKTRGVLHRTNRYRKGQQTTLF